MKLTKKSKLLLNYFNVNKLIISSPTIRKSTITIIKQLYNNIFEANLFLINYKKHNKYNVTITKIKNINNITKPKQFNESSFPINILTHINKHCLYQISYSFSLFNRDIKVFFIVEKESFDFDKYIDSIIMWFYIVELYASKDCLNNIVIYFYFTSL